jgi:hypothetical protein
MVTDTISGILFVMMDIHLTPLASYSIILTIRRNLADIATIQKVKPPHQPTWILLCPLALHERDAQGIG